MEDASPAQLTDIQRRLMDAYASQGYVRYEADVPQARGEIIMRRNFGHGYRVLQIIHRDGHTVTRGIRRVR